VEALGFEGDVLLAISTAGNSPNILTALDAAKQRGIATVGFTSRAGVKWWRSATSASAFRLTGRRVSRKSTRCWTRSSARRSNPRFSLVRRHDASGGYRAGRRVRHPAAHRGARRGEAARAGRGPALPRWLLDGLERQGFAEVILATGYMGDVVRDTLGDSHAGMALTYAPDEKPRGACGALYNALRVFVLNGDTWFGAPLAAEAQGADLMLAVRPVPHRVRYCKVRVEGNRILGLEGKGRSGPGLVNAGLYLGRRDLPARRPMPHAFILEIEVLAGPDGLDLRTHRTEAEALDIGTPEDFARAQDLIPAWAAP
jgi:hypothetical protein